MRVLLRLLQSKLGIVVLTMIAKTTYDLSYLHLVSPFFSWTPAYYPLFPNFTSVIESYLLCILLSLVVPRRMKKPSDFMLTFLGIAVILPMLTLHGLAGMNRLYTYMTLLVYLLINAVILVFPRVRLPMLHFGFNLARLCTIAVFITVSALIVSVIGIQHFDLSNILRYDKMVQIRELIINHNLNKNTMIAYLYFWQFIVFIPTLIVTFLEEKRWVAASAFVIAQILLTGLTARRHTIAILPILLGTYLLSKKPRLAPSLMIASFPVLVGITTIISLWFPDLRIIGTWMERFLFVPARLNYAYYEFFAREGHVYLTSTKIPVPLQYPFDMIPPKLIAYYILHNPKTVSSAGFLATSFMHAGFLGMIIFGFLVALLMRFADSLVVNRMPLAVGTALSMIVFYGLFMGAELTQWLLTFGGGLLFIMLFLIGTRGASKINRKTAQHVSPWNPLPSRHAQR